VNRACAQKMEQKIFIPRARYRFPEKKKEKGNHSNRHLKEGSRRDLLRYKKKKAACRAGTAGLREGRWRGCSSALREAVAELHGCLNKEKEACFSSGARGKTRGLAGENDLLLSPYQKGDI